MSRYFFCNSMRRYSLLLRCFITSNKSKTEVNQQRPEDVKLFFHTQGPGMQQRLPWKALTEIINFLRKEKIWQLSSSVSTGNHKILVCLWLHKHKCDRRRHSKNNKQRREYSLYSASIKIGKWETLLMMFPYNYRGDEIAGNNKENVNPKKAAREQLGLEMKKKHRQYRNGTKPINIFSVSSIFCRRTAIHMSHQYAERF